MNREEYLERLQVHYPRFNSVLDNFKGESSCRRKTVCCFGFTAYEDDAGELIKILTAMNGTNHECSNQVGSCGCAHAEPRAIMGLMRQKDFQPPFLLIQNYSPCSYCANVIVDSRIILGVFYRIPTEHDLRGIEILKSKGLFSVQFS